MIPILTDQKLLNYSTDQKTSDRKTIYVLKGFDISQIESLSNKLFQFPVYENLEILLENKAKMTVDIVLKATAAESEYYWCTYEEFMTAQDTLYDFFECECIENNLYNKLYPYQNTLTDIFSVYEEIYHNDDEEISVSQEEKLNAVSIYYGKIYYNASNEKYYVTYEDPKIDFDRVISFIDSNDLDAVPIINDYTSEEEVYSFELGDSEDEFLYFTGKIEAGNIAKRVRIFFADDRRSLPNNYDTRLAIIQYLAGEDYHISLATKQLNSRKIEREGEYKEILKSYWGYDSFKELKMYKDIETLGKETIEVSQAQIIDDIIEQSENSIQGQSFRDVYITSATGSGKSVMFQIPALYLANKFKDDGFLTIVISPLIGLMDDQVKSMELRNISNAKTIHSNLSQMEKEDIISGVQAGTVDILYISTETLQSRSDIGMLIGQRRVGLLVVDEAHIVTTWGKSFRADYWYMGSYLAKMRKKQTFPIVTFTATAIYGGKEDMYLETRDSLNMVNPIAYFGYVKRDDILMCVQSSQKEFTKYSREYIKTKFEIMGKRLTSFDRKKEKTLVYFPTVRTLNMFNSHLRQNYSSVAEKTALYYGSLDKHEKKESLKEFKDGDAKVMLATKAFGMGIDIPDIHNVYHYAPTGNVIDYIQEIGRAARSLPEGYAWFDFLPQDFTEVKRLHGMSTIKKQQLIEVMRKIVSLYEQKKNRNIVVSADDFKYIFNQNELEDSDIDNKLKITLLMIEKDFESTKKLSYAPFVARPRAMYGNELVFLSIKGKKLLESSKLKKYFTEEKQLDTDYYDSICQMNFKQLWEDRYPSMSFPQFKYKMYTEVDELKDQKILKEISPAMGVEINYLKNDVQTVIASINIVLAALEEFLRGKVYSKTYFNEKMISEFLQTKLGIQNRFEALGLSSVLLNSLIQVSKIKNAGYIKARDERGDLYNVTPHYMTYFDQMKRTINDLFYGEKLADKYDDKLVFYAQRSSKNEKLELEQVLLGVAEAAGALSYEIISGNSPQIYIRINSIYQLEKVIKAPQKYNNLILKSVHERHNISVELLTYLFKMEKEGATKDEKLLNYTEKFWDVIEDYFLGKLPDSVQAKLYRN